MRTLTLTAAAILLVFMDYPLMADDNTNDVAAADSDSDYPLVVMGEDIATLWCDACHIYLHGTCLMPSWWQQPMLVPQRELKHSPEPLRAALKGEQSHVQ